MILTWNAGTPLGDTVEGPKSYEIEGTLAGRTAGLVAAIAKEIGVDPNAITIVNTTEVHIEGVWRATLSDGDIDKPTNNRVAQHLRWLMQRFDGDARTIVWHVVKMVARFYRHKAGPLTKAQFQALAGKAYDAVTSSDADGS